VRSARLGTSTSAVEVTNVSRHGFWLWLGERELFVAFADFPWFRQAPIGHLLDVTLAHENHLYWPSLDIDIAVASIEHPDKYPLVSRAPARVADARPEPRPRHQAPRRSPGHG
jgi:hypothetical protein